jgi:hypothetical protein
MPVWRPRTSSATLATDVAMRAARRLVRGAWYGSTPNLRLVRVVEAMPVEIFLLILGAGGWRHGGMPICLLKKAVLGSSRTKTMFCLMSGLIDLAGDEFQKAPPEISMRS